MVAGGRSSVRTQGPIAAVAHSGTKAVDHHGETTTAAAYGSLRSQGRRRGCSRDTRYDFAISRRFAPEVCIFVCPPRNRGRREDRVLAAPAVSRAIYANKTAHEHTGQREHSGLPCAMALRLTSCSSRRTALLPPSPAGYRARSDWIDAQPPT